MAGTHLAEMVYKPINAVANVPTMPHHHCDSPYKHNACMSSLILLFCALVSLSISQFSNLCLCMDIAQVPHIATWYYGYVHIIISPVVSVPWNTLKLNNCTELLSVTNNYLLRDQTAEASTSSFSDRLYNNSQHNIFSIFSLPSIGVYISEWETEPRPFIYSTSRCVRGRNKEQMKPHQ